jgi:hypothetical protein
MNSGKLSLSKLLLVAYLLVSPISIVFKDSIVVQFESNDSITSLVDSQIISAELEKSNFITYLAVDRVKFNALIDSTGALSGDLTNAKIRSFLLSSFFPLSLFLFFFVGDANSRGSTGKSQVLSAFGFFSSIFALMFCIFDNTFLKYHFYPNVFAKISSINGYASSDIALHWISCLVVAGFFAYENYHGSKMRSGNQ